MPTEDRGDQRGLATAKAARPETVRRLAFINSESLRAKSFEGPRSSSGQIITKINKDHQGITKERAHRRQGRSARACHCQGGLPRDCQAARLHQ